MASFQSDRIFRMSSFNPTHRQMILRSDPVSDPNANKRIELHFGNVEYMALRPILRGVNVRPANMLERSEIAGRYGIERNLEFAFILDEGLPMSFVISGHPSWRAARCAIDDPSLFLVPPPWSPELETDSGVVD